MSEKAAGLQADKIYKTALAIGKNGWLVVSDFFLGPFLENKNPQKLAEMPDFSAGQVPGDFFFSGKYVLN